MNRVRGVLMLVAAGVAFYRGWRMHGRPQAALAVCLGAAALGLAIWHLTRRAPVARL